MSKCPPCNALKTPVVYYYSGNDLSYDDKTWRAQYLDADNSVKKIFFEGCRVVPGFPVDGHICMGNLYVCDCEYIGYQFIPVGFHTGIILVGMANANDAMKCVSFFTKGIFKKMYSGNIVKILCQSCSIFSHANYN